MSTIAENIEELRQLQPLVNYDIDQAIQNVCLIAENKRDPYMIPNVNFSVELHLPDDKNSESYKNTEELMNTFRQQRLSRGFDDSEVTNLGVNIAKFIYPRLKAYRESNNGNYPSSYSNIKDWERDLDLMIKGLDYFLNPPDPENLVDDISEVIETGLGLLFRNLHNLWR